MLEDLWIRSHTPGDGTIYILSGFANYNGGARFYRTLKDHTDAGGQVVAFLGGSTSSRLSSKQVVTALLDCGAEVNIVNRKRLMHAKCYGVFDSTGQRLVVTSGNFTGPGMSQNVEAAVLLDNQLTSACGFSWTDMEDQFHRQGWQVHRLYPGDRSAPAWPLLYDESPGVIRLEETEEVTLVLVLGHADTARVQAARGARASLGSQYFWLSVDSFDFFPPLTIRNTRGWKGTLSALIDLNYVDLGETRQERVTFEEKNNSDFRLGTGALRYTGIASQGDIACISRLKEDLYELRIFPQRSPEFASVDPYAVTYIGHQGKRYGYIDNSDFERITGISLGL